MTDWTVYRRCRICSAPTGQPCRARYTQIENGRPGGPAPDLPVAHGHRKRLHGR